MEMTMSEAVRHLDEKMKAYKNEMKEQVVDVEQQLREVKARGGRINVGLIENKGLRHYIGSQIQRAFSERSEEIKASDGGELMKPFEFKTVAPISSANLSGDNFISYLDWRPGMEPTGQYHFRNLVRTVLSETDFVQFPRANTPLGEGSFGRQTEEATKAQVDRDYTMVSVTLKPMAAYAIASRQSLRNIIFLQSWLPESLMDQLEDSEDEDFGNALVAAATGPTTTTGSNEIEKIVHYIRNLRKLKYNPNGICVDHDTWTDIALTTQSNAGYNLPSVVKVADDGTTRILGIPVRPVNWLTGGRVLVGDFSKAAIVQSEGLRLRQSDSHASIFTANQIAFLLERTENLVVYRPNAFVTAVI